MESANDSSSSSSFDVEGALASKQAHDSSSSDSSSFDVEGALASKQQQQSFYEDDRPRKISFHEPLTSSVQEIPRRTPEENLELFYQRQDFALFQAKEQQRYDKMMMKRIQAMVTEAMKDELEEAYARNATPEEIDAMMPQTTEEIFELLGGMPSMEDMMKPPGMLEERMAKTEAVAVEGGNDQKTHGQGVTNSDDIHDNPQQSQDSLESEEETDSSPSIKGEVKKERPDVPSQWVNPSDEELMEMFGVTENDKHATKVDEEQQNNNVEKKKLPQMPEKWADPSDEELMEMFGVTEDDNDDANSNGKIDKKKLPEKWAEPSDEELVEMFGLSERGGEGEDSGEVTSTEAVHPNFHLGNDDPSEIDILNKVVEKNDAVNDVLGTSFSSEVHVEDLVPLSPKNSPRHSPVRSPKGRPMVPLVNLDEDLFLETSS